MLPVGDQGILGLEVQLRIGGLRERHRRYLTHHRSFVFRRGSGNV
jgi:hypothetical protein